MMPRIRTVKPELFKHEDLYGAEVACQLPLRVAFVALFGCCDREGRFQWRPQRLKIEMLPYDDVDMAQVLDALVSHGFLKNISTLVSVMAVFRLGHVINILTSVSQRVIFHACQTPFLSRSQ